MRSMPAFIVRVNASIVRSVDVPAITLAASNGKRNVTVWRPSVRPSVPPFLIEHAALFSNVNRTRDAEATKSDSSGAAPDEY